MHEHASGYPRRESDGDQEGDSVGGHNGHGTAAADADGRRDTANRAAMTYSVALGCPNYCWFR
jgi:hypothetical protein